jgi:GNAT superfamily N-acetyltransferase
MNGLKRRALFNETSGASRTFVVSDDEATVMGYYALAAGAVAHEQATRAVRQNTPNPIPVIVLARLAVDRRAQGQQLGGALLLERPATLHSGIGTDRARALLVHGMHDGARRFYEHYGFRVCPHTP